MQDWIICPESSAEAAGRSAGRAADDVVDYRDWRLLLGVERQAIGTLDYYGELGYVFNRKFQYASSSQEFEPGDTFMIRIGGFVLTSRFLLMIRVDHPPAVLAALASVRMSQGRSGWSPRWRIRFMI